VAERDGERKVPRGYLKIAQVRHEGIRSGKQAIPNLMTALRKAGLDVALVPEEIYPTSRDLVDFRFLYMHGRNEFTFGKAEVEKLRFHLETGGLLFADACCGAKAFDASFRRLMRDIFPDKPLAPIPLNDELYGKELNGTALTTVRCRREGPGGVREAQFRDVAPALEGVKVNGRWAVVYSKYDIGCALERHQSTDCLGHDHDSAVQLGKAVVLYAMRR
jgi:hypothetical protein